MTGGFEIKTEKTSNVRKLECTVTVLDSLIHSVPLPLQPLCTYLTEPMEAVASRLPVEVEFYHSDVWRNKDLWEKV